MEKAKAAVSDFMHKAGHHDTTVHEKVAPAVVKENIVKHRHEEATTAIDREIHQDHFHTSIQPVTDREVLPEKHAHNIVGVETRKHHHGDSEAIKAKLEQERLKFQSSRTEGATHETHSVAPVIAGEHVHHHVHETIQPVVQKETIQPSVVHTTIPIHEVHHNEAKHHSASALPAVSMADFKKQGGSLQGREERYDGFEGEPKAVGGALGGSHHGSHRSGTTAGPHSSNLENKVDPRVDSDRDGSRNLGAASGEYGSRNTGSGYGSGATGSGYGSGTTGSGYDAGTTGTGSTGTGYGSGTTGSGYDAGTTGTGSTGTGYGTDDTRRGYGTSGTSTTTGRKPGLVDRLNPLKDTDGDGKKGVLE